MGESTGTKIGWAIGGGIVVLLGVLAYDALQPADMDEERPPIIVRGGSLRFISGHAGSEDPNESTGKPWITVGQDWQPDHPEGNRTKWFTVQLQASNQAACPAYAMTKEITITYQPAQGATSDFKVTLKDRPNHAGAPAPTIVGTGLNTAGTQQNPELVFDANGQGKIAAVRFQAPQIGNVVCPDPTEIRIWQLQ